MSLQNIPAESYNYRLSLAREIIRVVVLPSALLQLALSAVRLRLPFIAHALALVLSIPAAYVGRCRWTMLVHQREAARLGARLVPLAAGTWPGNLDFLKMLVHWDKTRYHGYMWSKFAADTGSTTANLGVFGTDMVGSHAAHVPHTEWVERLSRLIPLWSSSCLPLDLKSSRKELFRTTCLKPSSGMAYLIAMVNYGRW